MPQGHQDCQLHSNCSQHERTYLLSRQECHKGIQKVSFMANAASIRGLTSCKGKNATRASRLSASFQLQQAGENVLAEKARMPQGNQDCKLHSNCSQKERIYFLSSQESKKGLKMVSLIPMAPA